MWITYVDSILVNLLWFVFIFLLALERKQKGRCTGEILFQVYEAICRAEYKLERKGKKAEGKKRKEKRQCEKGFNYCLPDLFYSFPSSCFIFLFPSLLYAQRIRACEIPQHFFFPSPSLPLSVSLPPSLSLHSLRIIFSMTMSLPETYFFATRALRKGTTLHLNTAFFTMSWKCVIVNGDASPTITRTIYFTLVKAG